MDEPVTKDQKGEMARAEEEQVVWSATEWANKVRAQHAHTVDSAIAEGRLLIEAKANLSYRTFCIMFKNSPKAIPDPIPYSIDTAENLMRLARHAFFANSETFRSLPSGSSILCILAKVSTAGLRRALKDGIINPEMTAAEARALVKSENPERERPRRESTTAPPPEPVTIDITPPRGKTEPAPPAETPVDFAAGTPSAAPPDLVLTPPDTSTPPSLSPKEFYERISEMIPRVLVESNILNGGQLFTEWMELNLAMKARLCEAIPRWKYGAPVQQIAGRMGLNRNQVNDIVHRRLTPERLPWPPAVSDRTGAKATKRGKRK